jgi:Outer membrane lipoprotein-sorting protein
MYAIRTLLVCAVLYGATLPAHADDPEARALVTRMRDSVPTEPMVAKATLKGSGGWVRELTMSHKQIGDDRATLLEVTAPGDVAGSRYLFLERTEGGDRQFMYLPKLTARVIEVMDAARHEPFLGSDFYVSDLMAPDVSAFTYAFVGDEEILGYQCRLVEATAMPDAGVPYPKMIMAIDPDDLVVTRIQSFDAAGKLSKVWTLEKLETVEGQKTPIEQRMKNVQAESESTLTLDEVRYNVDLPDKLFDRGRLAR